MAGESPTIISLPISPQLLRAEVLYFQTINSTNAYLLGNHQHPNGTIVLADFQSAGHGRRGRAWLAPAGEALLFSFLLRANPRLTPLFVYSLLSAMGVRQALQELLPEVNFYLKWPNDVLLGKHKICGILVQNKIVNPELSSIVVGIGININQPPEFFRDLPQAGSLFSLTGKKFERLTLLATVIQRIDDLLQPAILNDPQWVISHWKLFCPFIGQTIQVDDGQKIYTGQFVDIDSRGALRLRTVDREFRFHAADVTIVKEYSCS